MTTGKALKLGFSGLGYYYSRPPLLLAILLQTSFQRLHVILIDLVTYWFGFESIRNIAGAELLCHLNIRIPIGRWLVVPCNRSLIFMSDNWEMI